MGPRPHTGPRHSCAVLDMSNPLTSSGRQFRIASMDRSIRFVEICSTLISLNSRLRATARPS